MSDKRIVVAWLPLRTRDGRRRKCSQCRGGMLYHMPLEFDGAVCNRCGHVRTAIEDTERRTLRA